MARGCFAHRRGRADTPPPQADAPHHDGGAGFAASLCKNAPGFTAMVCPGVLGPSERTALQAAMPAGVARSGTVVLHRGRSPGSSNAVTLRGCASGGFSERKSLLFHPKSASGPLQGQGLAQQNASRRDKGGNSHDGVGEEKADGSGASVFPRGEPGSCGPSEWGSLSWRESSHPKPGRALFSPQGSHHLASPPANPSPQLLPSPWPRAFFCRETR